MTANVASPAKKIYTLADLSALEAQHTSQPRPPRGLSNRIVTLRNLAPTAHPSNANSTSIPVSEALSSIDGLERNLTTRINTQFDNLDNELRRQFTEAGENIARQMAVQNESFQQNVALINQSLNTVEQRQNERAQLFRDVVIQRDNAENAVSLLITLLAIAVIAILAMVFL